MSYYSSSSYSTSGAVDSNGDPDLLYYNAQIISTKSNNSLNFNDDPPAVFSDIRSKPLINNVSNFDFSIMRFDMNGSGKKLPLFIPEIETQYERNNDFDINQTVYTIGATLNFNYKDAGGISQTKTIYQSRPITFNPENLNAPIPLKPNYPYGIPYNDIIPPIANVDYIFNKNSYKCFLTSQPVDAFTNRWDSTNTYNIGDIEYNGTTLASSLTDNNNTVIPLTTDVNWSVVELFSTTKSGSPPYSIGNYIYSTIATTVINPEFNGLEYDNYINSVSYPISTKVLYNDRLYQAIDTKPYYENTESYNSGIIVNYLGNLYTALTIPSYYSPTDSYIPTNQITYLGNQYSAKSGFPAYWSQTTTYATGNQISYNGRIYTSVGSANLNRDPTDSTYWTQGASYIPTNTTYWLAGASVLPTNATYWTAGGVSNPSNTSLFIQLGVLNETTYFNQVFKCILNVSNYWISGGPYVVGNEVSYIGNIYICIQNATTELPTNTSYWTLVESYNLTPKYWSKIDVYENPNTNIINFSLNPAPKETTQDFSTNYYYISSYESFTYMINNTLDSLWNSLSQAGKTFLQTSPAAQTSWVDVQYVAPYFSFNSSTQLFSIIAEQNYFIRGGPKTPVPVGGTTSPVGWKYTSVPIDPVNDLAAATTGSWQPTFQLFFNENLWNLFASFQTVRVPNTLTSLLSYQNNYPTMYYIPIYDDGDNAYTPPTNICESSLPAMFRMVQNYNTTGTLWSPVGSIVFCSTLPLFSEESSTPQLYDNKSGPNGYISSSTAPFINSITDISVPMTYAQDYRGFVNYVPSGEYRMIATTGQGSAISNIELQIFWRNRLDGRLYPIRLSNYSNINIKMLFRRKGHSNK